MIRRTLKAPRLTKAMLRDPSGLEPKVRELIKKLRKAMEATRSKSLDVLLLYMNVNAFERDLIISNFDNLLSVLQDEMKRESRKYMGWALLFASFNYRTYKNIYYGTMTPEESGELKPAVSYKLPEVKVEIPRLDPEMEKMFNERLDSLMEDLRTELHDGIKMDLENGRINQWDSKKLKKKLDERFRKAENRASMISRTEMMFAYNTYIIDQARKDGFNYLIWVTASDELVCDVCGPRHMKSFPIINAPEIPAHPNCRCTWMIPLEPK